MTELLLVDGWVEITLDEVALLNMGQSPKGEFVNDKKEGIPFYQGKTEFGKLYPKPRKSCTKPTKIAEDGDILLSVRAPVGPTNLCQETTCIGRGLAGIRAYVIDSQRYLHHFFRNIEPWLGQQGTGTTFKAVTGGFLREIPILVPPLAEQKQIATKLDELLAQVNTIKTRLDAIPVILKRFRQSVLAAAVSGKLTEKWREDDGGGNWKTKKLLDLCFSISDGDHQAPPKSKEGVPFFVISNVSKGFLNFEDVKRRVPQEYFDSLGEVRVPKLNDILYTVTGSFGIPVIVDTSKSFCFQRHIGIIKLNPEFINYKFLYRVLQSDFIFQQASDVATGTAQKTVSLKGLRGFDIPLPELEEQTQIVQRVQQLFTHTDKIGQKVKKAQSRVNNLTQSILAKAFRGELTAEWREQNPDLIRGKNSAEALLKRIKIEREKLKPVKKMKTKTKKRVAKAC